MPEQNKQQPRFIVIEGPIGVGKTTLVKQLATRHGSQVLLEKPQDNPFLKRFYNEGQNAALPTQLFFLFQRAAQFSELRQQDLFARNIVADFMLEKDWLFAHVTLGPEELNLYKQVYERVGMDAPRPDLVVYLQAPVTTLIQRIQRRGKPEERNITTDYLSQLSDAYTRFFTSYDKTPLLIINTAQVNLADNEQHLHHILARIDAHRHGRSFYNPVAELI
ncbi:MAG: deoxynucleoside kinase [Chromatiales bacterium]|jgi:deoxyadenosine/deoxycytidine kinase